MTQELIERLRATWKHDAWIATNRTAPPIRGEVEKLVNPDGPEAADALQSQSARIAEQDALLRRVYGCRVDAGEGRFVNLSKLRNVMVDIGISLTKDSTSG